MFYALLMTELCPLLKDRFGEKLRLLREFCYLKKMRPPKHKLDASTLPDTQQQNKLNWKLEHFWCTSNEWALCSFKIVFEKYFSELLVFSPLRRQMDPTTRINIRPSCNCCSHGYFACKLQNCVSTQSGKRFL